MAINSKLTLSNERYLQALEEAGGALAKFVGQSSIQMQALYRESDYLNRGLAGGIGRFSNDMKSFGQSMSIYVTLPILAMSGAMISAYAKIDSLSRGLDAITGSTQATGERMKELMEVSKLPGLGFEEAIQGDVRLRAIGFSAKMSKDALLQFGNAIASTGGGKLELGTVITQLGQMASKGKVLAEDLKPIINASPLVAKAIKDMFGTVDSEQISGKLKAVGKDSKQFIEELIARLSNLPRVTGGIGNALETFGDSAKIAMAGFGEALDNTLGITDKLNAVGDTILKWSEGFKQLDPNLQKVIIGVVGFVAVAPPLLAILGTIGTMVANGGILYIGFGMISSSFLSLSGIITKTLIPSIVSLYLAMSPIQLALAAVTAGVALFAFTSNSANEKVIELTDSQKSFNEVRNQSSSIAQVEISKLNALLIIASSHSKSLEDRKNAIKSINELSPKYLSNISLENIGTIEATKSLGLYTKALIENANIKASESKLVSLSAQLQEQQSIFDKAKNEYIKTVSGLEIQGVKVSKYVPKSGFLGQLATEVNEAKANVLATQQAITNLATSLVGKKVDNLGIATTDYTNVKVGGGKLPAQSEEFKAYWKELQDRDKVLDEIYKKIQVMIPKGVELGKIGSRLISGEDAFGKVGAVDNRKNVIAGLVESLDKSIPALQDKLKESAGIVGSGVNSLYEKTVSAFKKFDKSITEPMLNMLMGLNESMNQILQQGAVDAFAGIGDIAGKMLVGASTFASAGDAILSVIGGVFSQMGQQFLKAGVIMSGLQALLTNPFTSAFALIGVGLALTALGGAISGMVSSGGGGGSGASSYSSASSYSPSASSAGSMSMQRAIQVEVTGTTSIKGNDLYISYQNASRSYKTKR